MTRGANRCLPARAALDLKAKVGAFVWKTAYGCSHVAVPYAPLSHAYVSGLISLPPLRRMNAGCESGDENPTENEWSRI